MLEKVPAPFYPLDDYCAGSINNQKASIFREVGVEMSMQPMIDDAGVTILAPKSRRIHREIVRLPGKIKELKDYGTCRREITARMAVHEKTLETIKQADYGNMSVTESAAQFTKICDFVASLAHDRFMYALFPSFFAVGKLKKAMKKVDSRLSEYDLYANLDYRTALISRDMATMAGKIREDESLAQDLLSGMSYDRLLENHLAASSIFEEFLKENGYKLDFNCYCLYSSSYIENPDRLLNILRPLVGGQELLQEDEHRFESICSDLKQVCNQAEYDRLMLDIDDFRYFHVMREESQYYWETAFYYGRQALRRLSLLLYGTEDYTDNLAYLFINEFRTIEKTGAVSQELQEKIDLRRANRPLAKQVWEECKLLVFGEASDELKGISGSIGNATGPARIIKSPKEFHKMQQGDVLVCQYTDPEWTPLFKLASAWWPTQEPSCPTLP